MQNLLPFSVYFSSFRKNKGGTRDNHLPQFTGKSVFGLFIKCVFKHMCYSSNGHALAHQLNNKIYGV